MKKNLLFTSVGDMSRFYEYWIDYEKEMNYDIFVCYYGKLTTKPLKPFCKYYL